VSAAVHQLRKASEQEQTTIELWPEKGESEDDFMARCTAELTVCIGDRAESVCAEKWEASKELGKNAVGEPFITKRFVGAAAAEPCGASCLGCKGKSKEEILREARANIAGARSDLAAHVVQQRPEDPVRAWRRDGEAAQERAAKRMVRSTRGRAVEQQQGADTGSWPEWVRGEIRAEHERMIEIIGGVVAAERERVSDELATKIKALEAANAELRGLLFEKVGAIAERAGKAQLELGQRIATCERAMIGLKAQADTIEQTSNAVREYYKRFYGE
jgi:hypothetical protein